jgi:hypothetical protein
MEKIEPNVAGFEYYRSRFKKTFSFDERLTPWNCPHCNIGRLIAKEENFLCREILQQHSKLKPTLQYSGFFICNCCDHKTFSTGEGLNNYYCSGDDETGDYSEMYVNEYTPQFFSPPIMLFNPPAGTPISVKESLKRAFSLCWSDIPASCNVLRVTVEILLKEKWPEVPSVITGRSLNNKIKNIKKSEAQNQPSLEILDYLSAIKWLGNTGSHDDELEERDLAAAFKIMEKALMLLYVKDNNSVSEWVKMINAKQGSAIKP